MQAVHSGYRSLSLLMDLNWDRLLYGGTLCVALGAGAWLGSMIS